MQSLTASRHCMHAQRSQAFSASVSRHITCSFVMVSLQLASQPVEPSQASLPSRTPFPQRGMQSLSWFASAPVGQQPSSFCKLVIGVCVQTALQLSALPLTASRVQELSSEQSAGGGDFSSYPPVSQGSPRSDCTMPSPHRPEQSESLPGSQSAGQQPSPPTQPSMISSHSAWQPIPSSLNRWQVTGVWQVCGHAPGSPFGMPVSHFSPESTRPSPHRGWGMPPSSSVAEEPALPKPPPSEPPVSVGIAGPPPEWPAFAPAAA